jgi:hypothetical protein
MPQPTTTDEYLWNDLKPVLDEELSRLPDKYRVLIVLCDLEGRTRKETARQLDVPESTIASRLATARAMLTKRLARRGVVASGGLLGAVLSKQAASACVPAAVCVSTIKAATLVAAGQVAAGAISPAVAALVNGVTTAMCMTKIKSVTAVLLLLAMSACGGSLLFSHYAEAAQQGQPAQPTTDRKNEEKVAQDREILVKEEKAPTLAFKELAKARRDEIPAKPPARDIDAATIAAYEKLGATHDIGSFQAAWQRSDWVDLFGGGKTSAEERLPGFNFMGGDSVGKLPDVKVPFTTVPVR